MKAVGNNPKLLAKFVIAMWINEYKDVLSQDIDRFEQEMVVAIHWIPVDIWESSIQEMMGKVPEAMLPFMYGKLETLVSLLQNIFNATVSTDIASSFAAFLISGKIEKGKMLTISDITQYCAKIHGLSDDNKDLPLIKFSLTGDYYIRGTKLLPSYRVMIESAMCAAENACGKDNCINLFSYENREYARIVNFYRKYFKETYSEIFFNTIKYIKTQK